MTRLMLTLAEIDIDTWLMLIFGGHGCVYGSWIFGILAACYARVSPQAMDFSDDEDFFERAGDDDEDLLPFEGMGAISILWICLLRMK